MRAKASEILGISIVCSTIFMLFQAEINENIKALRHKWPVTRKMFQFDDVLMAKYALLDRLL